MLLALLGVGCVKIPEKKALSNTAPINLRLKDRLSSAPNIQSHSDVSKQEIMLSSLTKWANDN